MAAPKPFGVALQLVCCIVTTHDATEYRRYFGWVAQSAEQWTENPRVGGSIPPPAIPLTGATVQQTLQQNLANRECISCARTLLIRTSWLSDRLPARQRRLR